MRARRVRVHAEHDDGRSESWTADYVVDASGRDTFLGNRLQAKRRNKKHNSAALYAHFTGARRECGKREGNVTIYWFDHGWFWFIPLADGATSIGAVVWPHYMKTPRTSVREFFIATIALCPPLAERLSGATLVSEVEATGNYSYACDRSHGANYLLVGDAYSFVDPVFSSGVMLAMNSAVAAADAIHTCRTQPARASDPRVAIARTLRSGIRSRLAPWAETIFLVHLPGQQPHHARTVPGPRNVLRMEEALLSLLAGDIFGRTPIWGRLRLFKALYYAASFAKIARSFRAWRLREREPSCRDGHATLRGNAGTSGSRRARGKLDAMRRGQGGAAVRIWIGRGRHRVQRLSRVRHTHAYPLAVPLYLVQRQVFESESRRHPRHFVQSGSASN
jgi:hypothetical protein